MRSSGISRPSFEWPQPSQLTKISNDNYIAKRENDLSMWRKIVKQMMEDAAQAGHTQTTIYTFDPSIAFIIAKELKTQNFKVMLSANEEVFRVEW